MNTVVSEGSLNELLSSAVRSVQSFAAAVKASKANPPVDPAEVAKLRETADADRAAFDKKRREILGDPTSPEGKQNSRSWNHYAQKAYVIGLPGVNDNIFRYLDADGRVALTMRGTAVAYVNGHKALNWEVRHGVNPRSVQTLRDNLTKELAKAETAMDVNRVMVLRQAKSELERHASRLLEAKVNTDVQPRTAAASIGEQVGSATATAAVTSGTAPRTPRRARQTR